MEKAATDIYSFRELRENGFTYVGKTAIILPLCDMSIGKQFFMARPRRFGKSLLVSTLHCLFEGRRELFKGHATVLKGVLDEKLPRLGEATRNAFLLEIGEDANLRTFFDRLLAA